MNIAEPKTTLLPDQLKELSKKAARAGRMQWFVVVIILASMFGTLLMLGLHYIVVPN